MTAKDILRIASSDYSRIYREEDEATGVVGHLPGLMNRAKSEGPYGIWGHVLGDLYFEEIVIDEVKREINFSIGS